MTESDVLVTQEFIPFRAKVLEVIKEKHPYLINMVEMVLANKENSFGLRITDNNEVVGEYTIHAKGIYIVDTEIGKLASQVKHPILGLIIKPYAVIEKDALHKAIHNNAFMNEPFQALIDFLPNVTIKFLE